METKSNNIYVGGAVLLLLAALIAFTVWLANLSGGKHKEYDIFFRQAVDGVATGAAVTFAGVPAGQVKDIALWKPNPEFVKVRIVVNEDIPILAGTTASIAGIGFTGVSQISLQGAVKGAPPITDVGPAGVPTIPTKTAGLGALLNNAPQLIERLTSLSEKLADLVSDDNQASIRGILANMNVLTRTVASEAPAIKSTLQETQLTIQQAGNAAAKIAALTGHADNLLDGDGKPAITELKRTLAAAQTSLANFDAAIADARPGLKSLSEKTAPQAAELINDLRNVTASLGNVATRLDQGGATAILSGSKLPDYQPRKAK